MSVTGRGASSPPDAYELMAELGVGYDSSMAEILRCALRAQRAKTLTRARQDAWAQLRVPDRRLLLDVLYFQDDPAAFGAPEPEPSPEPPPAPPAPAGPAPALVARALGQLAPGEAQLGRSDLWRVAAESLADGGDPKGLLLPGSFLEEEL